jgi:hypothetical protein
VPRSSPIGASVRPCTRDWPALVIPAPVNTCTYVRPRNRVPVTYVPIPVVRRALAFQPFEIPSHGRNVGVRLGGGVQGVNGANRNDSRKCWRSLARRRYTALFRFPSHSSLFAAVRARSGADASHERAARERGGEPVQEVVCGRRRQVSADRRRGPPVGLDPGRGSGPPRTGRGRNPSPGCWNSRKPTARSGPRPQALTTPLPRRAAGEAAGQGAARADMPRPPRRQRPRRPFHVPKDELSSR